MKLITLWTVLLAFLVGLIGAATAIIVNQQWSRDSPVPLAMTNETESQYPDEYKSFLEIGSRFPDETYYTEDGDSRSFYEVFASGPAVILLWSPGCESCVEQAALWESVMRPSLLPEVIEIACLPLVYKDSADFPRDFLRGTKTVFVDDERMRTLYRLIVMPTVIAVDSQGFITAIQYAYSEQFTADLIEAVTVFEVGPCVRVLNPKDNVGYGF